MHAANIEQMKKKTAIVTGGAQGIGKMISLRLAESGYGVTIWDTDEEALAEVKHDFTGHNILVVPCDVSSELQVEKAVKITATSFGGIGCLVNNARLVLFLADPVNSFITGQNFIADGGMTKRMIYV